ncbi:MAG: galactose ABC transporter substrate-binding protein [Clostridiales bacterium]|nr:galactose ABC transporter substrate-binding protein [Clostridiales bacterium]
MKAILGKIPVKLGIMAAMLAAAAVAAAVAAGIMLRRDSGANVGQNLKIGVFMYRGDDTFISNLMNSLRDIVSAYEREQGANLYLSIQDAQGSQATQNTQIERSLSLGYNILCVNVVDRTSVAYVIDKAMEADVPLIFFNREPVQADLRKWDKLYYVGTDASMNGRLEGQIIVDAYRENPERLDLNNDGILQYIMIEGEFRHQDAILRTESSIQAIVDAGIMVEKLDGGTANWERSQAAALAKDYFTKYGSQIEVILCNNDDMALGVIDYVSDNQLDFTNIVGVDGTPQGLQAVYDGKMEGTVVIDYEAQAKLIFEIVLAHIKDGNARDVIGMTEERYVRAPMYVVRREGQK